MVRIQSGHRPQLACHRTSVNPRYRSPRRRTHQKYHLRQNRPTNTLLLSSYHQLSQHLWHQTVPTAPIPPLTPNLCLPPARSSVIHARPRPTPQDYPPPTGPPVDGLQLTSPYVESLDLRTHPPRVARSHPTYVGSRPASQIGTRHTHPLLQQPSGERDNH